MASILLVAIGKIKNPHLKALEADYAARLKHYTTFEIKESKDSKLRFLSPSDYVVTVAKLPPGFSDFSQNIG